MDRQYTITLDYTKARIIVQALDALFDSYGLSAATRREVGLEGAEEHEAYQGQIGKVLREVRPMLVHLGIDRDLERVKARKGLK